MVKHLLQIMPDRLAFSVSATTRKPRPTEEDGREYYFISEEKFREGIERGEFLEYEEVYPGILYGTKLSEIERIHAENKAVVFDVDVQGGLNIKRKFGDAAMSVFLRPPTLEILMQRLRNRSTEVEHQLKQRITKAKYELTYEKRYDKVVVNDVLENTFIECEKLVNEFLTS